MPHIGISYATLWGESGNKGTLLSDMKLNFAFVTVVRWCKRQQSSASLLYHRASAAS